MTKAGRLTPAVAISLLLLLSLPELTCAQQPVFYGTWNGYATYTETDYDQWQNVIGGYSWAGNSTLTLEIFQDFPGSYTATASGGPAFNQNLDFEVTSFGPTSASGYDGGGGPAGFGASFDVTYQSILPDGQFDTTVGFAVADYSGDTYFGYGTQPYKVWFASFSGGSLPEPSAIVPMAIGAVVVATSVVIRRRRAGRSLERARAAGGLEAQSSERGVPPSRQLC